MREQGAVGGEKRWLRHTSDLYSRSRCRLMSPALARPVGCAARGSGRGSWPPVFIDGSPSIVHRLLRSWLTIQINPPASAERLPADVEREGCADARAITFV